MSEVSPFQNAAAAVGLDSYLSRLEQERHVILAEVETLRSSLATVTAQRDEVQKQYDTLTKLYGRATAREEALKSERDNALEGLRYWRSKSLASAAESLLATVTAERDAMRKALEFYADSGNYMVGVTRLVTDHDTMMEMDCGKRARTCLASAAEAEGADPYDVFDKGLVNPLRVQGKQPPRPPQGE